MLVYRLRSGCATVRTTVLQIVLASHFLPYSCYAKGLREVRFVTVDSAKFTLKLDLPDPSATAVMGDDEVGRTGSPPTPDPPPSPQP